ncbi:YhgE/Pip domain-containing protein [Thermoactinomyces intermedius]|jgi:putative membrane protein|uniref:YhgE/Pip domain-containing protein n=1 Tax=Thermoactinomyces intermedius TaxID=2024 RepID=A0A8I1A7M6_THEIN|nr:YhgE/Pip domain-containing protein [Thermoactinomyces intermedius]MBA4550015.1 YhgE/Pip domain-containing protein [Thermoactinomyces intermedius]MBA4835761.1 YhgE/Pip domain-containing protein [Thermoactinomyces intermedius]MBH8596344.1 YhgE/Pip domain-containing protein [Thermoactinomyces intermedius]
MKRRKENQFLFLSGFKDLDRLWDSKPMRLGLVGILLIPLIYCVIYLSAFYDPYENLKYLPVALVNEDQGTVRDGENLNVGNELVEELQKDSKVKWELTDRNKLEEGLDKGTYYMGIVIPKNFSQAVASVDSPEPLKGQLEYHVDKSNNYLSGTIGDSIKRELEMNLDEKLSKIYVEQIFAQLSDSVEELQKAANGAGLLAEKTGDARSGSQTIAGSLSKLDQGASKILGYLQLFNQKATQAEKEINKIPMEDMEKAQQIIHQVNDEIQKLARIPLPEDPPDLKTPLSEGQRSVKKAAEDVRKTEADLNRLIEKHPELAQDPSVLSMKEALKQAEAGNTSGMNRFREIDQKIPDWEKHWKEFLNERQKVADHANQLTQKVDQAVAKAKELKGKASQLVQATSQLSDGQQQLVSGIRQLETGAGKLSEGLGKIQSGQSELAQGLSDGVDKAKDQLQGSDQKEEVISDPVQIKENVHHDVPNYATGFAPYFISLSLWVGAMLLFTVVDLYQVFSDRKEPLSVPAAGLIGIGQAVLLITAVIWGLKIEPELPGWLYLFSIVMSITFIALNHMLNVFLGNVGRFLSIGILMLQLASSAGTYPLELLPSFFRTIHDYLPMTYTVQGLRAILSSGNMEIVEHCMYLLFAFMAAAIVITQFHLQIGKPLLKKGVQQIKLKWSKAS